MPLSELPPGHVGRNGFVEEPTGRSPEGSLSNKNPTLGARHGFLETPSSIQSMLKNTTETGDVGQFWIKPAQVPSMVHRMPKPPNAATPVHAKKRQVGEHYYPQKDNFQRLMYPGNADPSMVTTSYHTRNQRSYRGRIASAGGEEGERSYSMTQSSSTSQSFSHRPSPTDFHLHDQENLRGSRPRSPFAYPTRLKRPGYRPSSPALSDYNRPGLGTHMPSSQAPSFRTASPLSVYTPKRAPHAWQQNINRSDPMLRYYAPSPRYEGHGEAVTSPSQKPLSQLPNEPSSLRLSTPTQLSDVSVSRRTSPSPPPVFYDYTESFEENHYHNVSMSSFSLAEQVIPEDTPRAYHELDSSAASQHVAELPAHSNSMQDFVQIAAQILPKRPTSTEVIGKVVANALQLDERPRYPWLTAAGEEGQESKIVDRGKGHNVENNAAYKIFPGASTTGDTLRKGLESTQIPEQDQRSPSDEILVPKPSNSPLVSVRLSSSSTESMYSLRSSPRDGTQTPIPDLTEPSENISQSPARLEIPLVQSRNSNTTAENPHPHPAYVQRGTSFDGKSDTTDHTEIISPTPERAASSLSNCNRFSRILSLNDDLADANDFTTQAKAEAVSKGHAFTKSRAAEPYNTRDRHYTHDAEYSIETAHGRARATQEIVKGLNPTDIQGAPNVSKNPLNIPPMHIPRRRSSRSLQTAMCDNFTEPTIPPRRSSYIRRPAYHLFEPPTRPITGLPVVTEDLDKIPTISQNLAQEDATISRTVKELPPLPKEHKVADLILANPVLSASALITNSSNRSPTPDIPSIELEPIVTSKSKQVIDMSTAPVELSAVGSLDQSVDLSTIPAELPAAVAQEQCVEVFTGEEKSKTLPNLDQSNEIQNGQREPTGALNAHQSSHITAIPAMSGAVSKPEQSLGVQATPAEPRSITCPAISSSKLSESNEDEKAPITKYKLKLRADRDSPPSLQPWNLETSYPWTDNSPKLDVTIPQPSEDPPEQTSSRIPRFKLKLHRASSTTAGTTKITKQRPSLDSYLHANVNASNDLFGANACGRKPRPSITISQENSSQSPHLQTRFKESFEQAPATFAISPTITLVPPSPGLNLEARSFFSDDSSMRNKGSLRKRLSQLRAMASRNTMSEDGRSFDRDILRSGASGRISKQSGQNVEGAPQSKSVRSKVAEKVKGWLLRGGEKVRGLWRSRGD